MRVHGALGELLAHRDLATIRNTWQHLGAGAHHVLAEVALLVVDRERLLLLVARDLQRAGDLGEHGEALRLARLEQLLNARQTVRDVLASHAAGVERAHGELGARLADGLGGDDAHRRADVHRTARGEIPAIALLAHAVVGVAGHDRADDHFFDAGTIHLAQLLHALDVLASGQHHFPVGARSVLEQAAADEVLVQIALLVAQRIRHAVGRAAIDLADDDVLRHVHETAGEVSRVGGAQRRVGEALAGAVRGDEVLEHR